MRSLLLREGREKLRGERGREGVRITERRRIGRRGDEVERRREEAFLVMWPRTLSAAPEKQINHYLCRTVHILDTKLRS